MHFVSGLAILLAFQVLGEFLATLMKLPAPGPVVGMVLLFFTLFLMGEVPKRLEQVSVSLIGHLSLFFVPAGVGTILYLDLLKREWWAILIAIVVTTLLSLVFCALVIKGLSFWFERKRQGSP